MKPAESVDIQASSGTFSIRVDVRWGEMDALRHVNNAAYFRYFEEARVQLLYAMGLFGGRGRDVVLAHAACDFLKPLMYPACIVVGLKRVRLGRSSLELECWISDAADPEIVHASGRNVLVCIDGRTGRPAPWSEAEIQALDHCFSTQEP